jgi:hypothetical protein
MNTISLLMIQSPVTPRFPLGRIVYSGTVTLLLRTEELLTALERHSQGDWGDLLPEDAVANDLALVQGGRLFSAYGLDRDRFWIITDADRSRTIVLLPED